MCCFTGSQLSCLRMGVTWSYFFDPLTILQAKFWTAWSLAMLDCEVLLQTEEQWNSLLKTNALIMIIKVRLSKQCLTRFIWPSLDIQEATVAVTWWSKVKLVSSITPRSLAVSTGASCFPRNDSLKSRVSETPSLLPQTKSFVLSGFNSNWLSKHQLRILVRSWFISATMRDWSWCG